MSSDARLLKRLDEIMPDVLRKTINNILNVPTERIAQIMAQHPHVEIPVMDADGVLVNTYVIVSASGIYGAFWLNRCTAQDTQTYASHYGSQHPVHNDSDGYDIDDSVAGCMAFPHLAGQLPKNGQLISDFVNSYHANLGSIFSRKKRISNQ